MNGMKEWPEFPCRDVLVLQFISDGSERLYHYALPHFAIFILLVFAVIASWGDERSVPVVRLAVANYYHCKHIYILRIEILQCCDLYALFLTSCLSHVSYDSVLTSIFEIQFFQTVQLPVSAVAFRVIYCSDEVSFRCSFYPFLYHMPRRHEVAHGYYAEVVSHRSTE